MPTETNIDMLLLQLGIGQVGAAVVSLAKRQAPTWCERFGVAIRYYALADSSGFVVPNASEHALSPKALASVLTARTRGQPLIALQDAVAMANWRNVLEQALLAAGGPDRLIVVDCATGCGTTEMLLAARAAGAHIVLCNKDPLTGPYRVFQALQGTSTSGSLRLSVTVGAGLPITSAIAAAAASGDAVLSLSAVTSGSLGQLCTAISGGMVFADALHSAIAAGYCEPDPRLDLSGHDVARKLLILARLAGHATEMADIVVESLLPPGADALSRKDFLETLPSWRSHLADHVAAARASGRVLRYVGTMDARGRLRANLRTVSPHEPLAQGHGPENVFVLHTARYRRYPLVIAGPGAGVAVTAGAIVSDILRVTGVP